MQVPHHLNMFYLFSFALLYVLLYECGVIHQYEKACHCVVCIVSLLGTMLTFSKQLLPVTKK